MDKPQPPWRKNSKYSKNEQEMWDYILADSMNVTTLFNRMAALEEKVHKLEEAYYLQFPDRLEKDIEFQKQFSALKNPTDPDASRKKP